MPQSSGIYLHNALVIQMKAVKAGGRHWMAVSVGLYEPKYFNIPVKTAVGNSLLVDSISSGLYICEL